MKKLNMIAMCASLIVAASGSAIAGGAETYKETCMACHAAGVANAPKLEDKAAWKPRIALGKDVLYASVLKGKGAMPPKAGRADLSDDVIKAAVDYMVGMSK